MRKILFALTFSPDPWRKDGKCGVKNILSNGKPGQCDPNASDNKKGPCCSSIGWCGNSAAHCKCDGCVDYRKKNEIGDAGEN